MSNFINEIVSIEYDENGNFIRIDTPESIKEVIYKEKRDEETKQEILRTLVDYFDYTVERLNEVTDEQLTEIMQTFYGYKDFIDDRDLFIESIENVLDIEIE